MAVLGVPNDWQHFSLRCCHRAIESLARLVVLNLTLHAKKLTELLNVEVGIYGGPLYE
jgi:hypothetical protein